VNPTAVAPQVRRAVEEVLKTVRIGKVTTLSDQVDASLVLERMMATLSGTFGALGACLAAVGLYGLLAYTVTTRTNEIGVRMALGATTGDVSRLVLKGAFGLVCAGLVLGVPIAVASQRFAASLVPGLAANSPLPIAVAGLIMIAIALVAAYVPARRAMRVQPVTALRHH
jgi:putative ABC transport system permease protein